eukprot:6022981-Prymnesium_polylepis.1
MTNADGVAMYDTPARGSAVRVPTVDASGWEHGAKWVRLDTIGELWEKGSRNLLRLGLLWYTIAGD